MAGVLAGEVCGESRRWLMGEHDLADTESETSPDTAFCHTQSDVRAVNDPSPGTVKR